MTIEKERVIKVLHIASGDLWAGAEVQLYFLAKALAVQHGIRQHVIVLNHGILEQKLTMIEIPVTVLDESGSSAFALITAIHASIKSFDADIVHTHRRKENILGTLSSLVRKKTISIRTVHGSPEHSSTGLQLKQRLINLTDYLVARLFQKSVVAVSSELRDCLQLSYGSKVFFIPNGIDDIEMPPVVDKSSDRQARRGRVVVAFAGRLVPVKRIDLFIEIARLAEALEPGQFEFRIFGDGPGRIPAEQLIDEYQLQDLVSIKGFVPNIHAELASADLLVITSDHEGLPMILLEAVSLGIPVIARAVGEIPVVLGNGSGGCLISNDQPAEFVQHLHKYQQNSRPFEEAAIIARQNLLRNYTATICAERYRRLYERLYSADHPDCPETTGERP